MWISLLLPHFPISPFFQNYSISGIFVYKSTNSFKKGEKREMGSKKGSGFLHISPPKCKPNFSL